MFHCLCIKVYIVENEHNICLNEQNSISMLADGANLIEPPSQLESTTQGSFDLEVMGLELLSESRGAAKQAKRSRIAKPKLDASPSQKGPHC